MAKPDESSVLADLKSALKKGGSTRSPLFVWMLKNHNDLLEAFEEMPPNWAQVTKVLTERGFTGTDGKPLNPQSVRRMWHRVRQSHAKAQARKRVKGEAPAAASAKLEPVALEITEQEPTRPRFQPARPRHMPTGEPLAPPKPRPAPERPTQAQLDEQSLKLKSQMEAKAGRMPEPIFEGKKDGRQETGSRDR
jgi:hypothetical protein